MKLKFAIKTLGCKTNQIESSIIEEKFTNAGFEYSDSIEECDFFVLNSCSVTNSADNKSLAVLKSVKNKNPNIKIVLTGCFAQLQAEKLKQLPYVDFLIGNQEKLDILEILQSNKKYSISDIFLHSDFKYEKLNRLTRTRAAIKIQDGCDNRCSYCTIPLARGKNRSNPVSNIIEQIKILENNNYQEVVLTGIHIGQWGNDFSAPRDLLYLIDKIEKTNIKRYRLGSLNPMELNDEFIDYLSKSNKFCPHFHLSLQSTCDKTLKNMNRTYDFDVIKQLVNRLNEKFKLPFLGSDIIVGFPDETLEDFEITYKNLQELPLSQIHVFPYSKRDNTPAAIMPNQINEKTKKERVKIIKELSEKKHKEFLIKNIETENQVIIEKNPDKKSGLLKGITGNYINVLIEKDKEYKSTFQNIKIEKFSEKYNLLTGSIIK